MFVALETTPLLTKNLAAGSSVNAPSSTIARRLAPGLGIVAPAAPPGQ